MGCWPWGWGWMLGGDAGVEAVGGLNGALGTKFGETVPVVKRAGGMVDVPLLGGKVLDWVRAVRGAAEVKAAMLRRPATMD